LAVRAVKITNSINVAVVYRKELIILAIRLEYFLGLDFYEAAFSSHVHKTTILGTFEQYLPNRGS
jgi:hypothetical protein